jgi:hypothetical protein
MRIDYDIRVLLGDILVGNRSIKPMKGSIWGDSVE